MKWFRKRTVIRYREGPEWWEKIRLYFSTILLDLAERIPEVKAGFLHHLQFIRQQQREDSQKNFENYQIPKETKIFLLGFQLLELIHIEDIQKLRNALRELFPDRHVTHHRDVDEFHGDISRGGWQNQGYLVPSDHNMYFLGDERAVLENLPSEIRYIQLFTHQITPSLIGLALMVRLSDEAQTKIVDFFEKKYLHPTKLGWYERKHEFLTHSGTGFFEFGAETEFRKWSQGLQQNIEIAIRDYFPGYFGSEVRGENKLSRIDLFAITESVADENEISDEQDQESKNRQHWKGCLGLDVFPGYIDVDDNTRWSFPERWTRKKWSSRIVVEIPTFVKGKDMLGHKNEDDYVWYVVTSWLREMTVPYSLAEYFKYEKEKVAKIRKMLFQEKNMQMKMSAHRLLRLLADIQSNLISLDRALMEYDLIQEYVQRDLDKIVKSFVVEYDENWTLADAFSNILASNRKILEKHSVFLQTTLNQIVNVVNLRETRNMTVFSIILSFLSLIIALIALSIDWSNYSLITK